MSDDLQKLSIVPLSEPNSEGIIFVDLPNSGVIVDVVQESLPTKKKSRDLGMPPVSVVVWHPTNFPSQTTTLFTAKARETFDSSYRPEEWTMVGHYESLSGRVYVFQGPTSP